MTLTSVLSPSRERKKRAGHQGLPRKNLTKAGHVGLPEEPNERQIIL
jgi:hypothetical protein